MLSTHAQRLETLLTEAGYTVMGLRTVRPNGEDLYFELTITEPAPDDLKLPAPGGCDGLAE